jgi:ribosomal 50S subunit-recycling heat shock protein
MIETDTAAQIYTVENTEEFDRSNVNQRLDIWLSNQIPDLSRSRIQTLISQGNVKVNDETCTSKKISVKTGDRIQITSTRSPAHFLAARSNSPRHSLRRRQPNYHQQTSGISRPPSRRTPRRYISQRFVSPLSPSRNRRSSAAGNRTQIRQRYNRCDRDRQNRHSPPTPASPTESQNSPPRIFRHSLRRSQHRNRHNRPTHRAASHRPQKNGGSTSRKRRSPRSYSLDNQRKNRQLLLNALSIRNRPHPSNSRAYSGDKTSDCRRPDVQFQPFYRRQFNRTSPPRMAADIAASNLGRINRGDRTFTRSIQHPAKNIAVAG